MPTDKKYNQTERYAVFLFGLVFLTAILVIVIWIPKPTLAQFFVFRLVLGLAAGGVGAFIPGFIHFHQVLPHKGAIRFGGALGLFAVVWFTNPAKFAIEDIAPPPPRDGQKYIDLFMRANDATELSNAYEMLSDKDKATVSSESYAQLVNNVRVPLGKRTSGPVLWGTSNPENIAGRQGPFVINSYQSTFTAKPGVWVEVAGAIAEEGKWKIFSYTIQECLPPMCVALDRFSKGHW